MEKLHIETMGDVRSFFYYLIHECELGGGFHPDTPIADYVVVGTNKATFTDLQQVANLQHGLDKCFEVCERFEQDIYEQGVEPRAYIQMLNTPEMEINGCVIHWTGTKWTCTDEIGTVSGWREFHEAIKCALGY